MISGQPPPTDRSRLGAFAAALFAVVVWGASFAVTRAAVREIPPLTLAFLRFFLAAALLWPLGGRIRIRLTAADRLAIFALGFVGVTLYFAFENLGLQFTTASHGALIVATIPLATELVLARRDRRRPPPAVLFGLLAAFAGVTLIFGRDTAEGSGFIGDLLMLGAVLSWVAYTLIAERLVPRFPGLFLTWKIMAVGAFTLLPAALVESWFLPFALPSSAAWAGVGFLGVFCSALGYLAWNHAIPILGVNQTNILIYLIPLVGVLTGVLGLDEPFTARIALGGALIIGGVAWAGWRQQKNR
jgi:drug/metabolite transporter (DMT)-like permease